LNALYSSREVSFPTTLIDSSILFVEAEDCLKDFSRSNRLSRSSFNRWDLATTRKNIFSDDTSHNLPRNEFIKER